MTCPFCLIVVPEGASLCPRCHSQQLPELYPPYAGIFRRWIAQFFDFLLLSIFSVGLYFGSVFLLIYLNKTNLELLPQLLAGSVTLLFLLIQFLMFFISGQTIGKKICGAKVIRVDYRKAGFGTLLMREVIGRMILCSLTFGIGYIIALFNPRKQGLHDKIAGTIVVRKLKRKEYTVDIVNQSTFQPNQVPQSSVSASSFSQQAPVSSISMLDQTKPQIASLPYTSVKAQPEANTPKELCPGCQSPIEDPNSKFCLVCGYPVKTTPKNAEQYCPACKSPVFDGMTFCSTCGFSLTPNSVSEKTAVEEGYEATIMVGTPQIVSYSPDGLKEIYSLQIPTTKIGRLKDNHIVFPNEKSISGHHCEIYADGNQFFIRDLGSTNGIFVNNQKVDVSPLKDGDKIKLGFKVFRFTQI